MATKSDHNACDHPENVLSCLVYTEAKYGWCNSRQDIHHAEINILNSCQTIWCFNKYEIQVTLKTHGEELYVHFINDAH